MLTCWGDEQDETITDLRGWISQFSLIEGFGDQFSGWSAFAGLSEDTLASLVLHNSRLEAEQEEILEKCKADLLWIAPPEAVWRIFRSSLDPVEQEKWLDMYKHQQHHDLVKLMTHLEAAVGQAPPSSVSHDWVGHHGGMKVLVRTHANILQTDVEAMMKGSPFHVVAYKLGAYRSEKQLSTHVSQFLNDSQSDMFVLQCHTRNDAEHLLLAQFTLDQMWRECDKPPPCKKHMCIVLHMPREESEQDRRKLPSFSFQCGWKQVFLDCLEPCGLLSAQLLGMTIARVLQDGLLSSTDILQENLQSTLLCVPALKHRSPGEILKLAEDIRQRRQLVKLLASVCTDHINDLVADGSAGINRAFSEPVSWQVDVACNRTILSQTQSFGAALAHRVSGVVRETLASLLQFMIKSTLLPILLQSSHLAGADRKLSLAESLLKSKSIVQLKHQLVSSTGLAVHQAAFFAGPTSFPLALLFFQRMEQHHHFFTQTVKSFEDELTGASDKDCVHGAICQLRNLAEIALEEVPESSISNEWTQDLLSDFLDWKLKMLEASADNELSSRLLLCLLEPYWEEECLRQQCDAVTMVAFAHGAFWEAEEFVGPLLRLLEAVWKISGDGGKQTILALLRRTDLYYGSASLSGEPGEAYSTEIKGQDSEPASNDNAQETPTIDVYRCSSSPEASEQLLTILCLFILSTAERFRNNVDLWNKHLQNFLLLTGKLRCQKPPIFLLLRICADLHTSLCYGKWKQQVSSFCVSLVSRGDGLLGDTGLDDTILQTIMEFIEALQPALKRENANQVLLQVFTHWLDAAGEHPGHIDLMLNQLRESSPVAGKTLVGPILHRVLLRAEEEATDMISSAFETRSESQQNCAVVSALDQIVAPCTPGHPFPAILCNTIQKLSGMKSLRESWTSPDINPMPVFKGALDCLSATSRLCYLTVVAVAAARSVIDIMFSAQKLSSLARRRIANFGFYEEFDVLLSESALGKNRLPENLRTSVLLYASKQLFHHRQAEQFEAVAGVNSSSLRRYLDAILFPEKEEVKASVNGLVLVDTFNLARQDLVKVLGERQPADFAGKLVEACVGDRVYRRAMLCVLSQVIFLKAGLQHQKSTEKKIAEGILNRQDILKQLPVKYTESLQSVLTSKFSTKLFQQVSSEPEAVNLVTVLLHFLSILSASGVSPLAENASPLLRLFMEPRPDTFVVGNAIDLVSTPVGEVSTNQMLSICPCGNVFLTSSDASCPSTSCKATSARKAEADRQKCLHVEVSTYLSYGDDHHLSKQPGYHDINFKQLSSRSLGFCLPDRRLPPLYFHILNFLTSAAVYLGLAVSNDSHAEAHLRHFLGRDVNEGAGSVGDFLEDQLKGNWNCLQRLIGGSNDDVHLLLHGLLARCADMLVESRDDHGNFASAQQRLAWEERFCRCAEPVLSRPMSSIKMQRSFLIQEIAGACDDASEKERMALLSKITEADQQSAENSEDDLSALFQQTAVLTKQNLIAAFFSSPQQHSEMFPVLSLFLQKIDELALVRFLPALLNWNRFVRSSLSGQLTREEMATKTVNDFLDDIRGEEDGENKNQERGSKLFDELLKAWDNLANSSSGSAIGTSDSPHQFKHLQASSSLVSTVIDTRQESAPFWIAVNFLRNIQHSFLATVLGLFAQKTVPSLECLAAVNGKLGIPSVPLETAKNDIIQVDVDALFTRMLVNSQVSPGYGCGHEVRYDFDRMQREVINEVVTGKAFLSLSEQEPTSFPYSGDLLTQQKDAILEVKQIVQQEALPSAQEKAIEELREAERRQLKADLEKMISLVPRAPLTNLSLAAFHQKWLGRSSGLSLTSLSPSRDLEIKHLVALYEAVEANSHQLAGAVNSLPECFRETLASRTQDRLLSFLGSKIPAKDFLDVLQRLAFRELQALRERERQSKADVCLADYLGDIYVWPQTTALLLLQLKP